MKRLALILSLILIAMLLSGCLDLPPSQTGSNLTKHVSIDESNLSSVYGASFNVYVTEPWINSDNTAELRIEVTNTGDESIKLGTGGRDVFTEVHDNEEYLELVTKQGSGPRNAVYDNERNCWFPRSEYGYYLGMDNPHSLSPGETKSMVLKVVSPSDTDSCLPMGEYRFEQEYTIHNTSDQQNDTTRFTWGFDIRIEDLDPNNNE